VTINKVLQSCPVGHAPKTIAFFAGHSIQSDVRGPRSSRFREIFFSLHVYLPPRFAEMLKLIGMRYRYLLKRENSVERALKEPERTAMDPAEISRLRRAIQRTYGSSPHKKKVWLALLELQANLPADR
jgi:hypothetical protein